MKQLQVTVPKKSRADAEEILEKFSSDISSSEAEKDGDKVIEFRITAESDQIDDLTEKLKTLDGIDSGDLTIRVMQQESLIRKGQQTRGSSSMLSQAELYSQAQESASFNRAQWSLIGLSAIIATYGLVADNVIVVIGAMMVAPILSPFISGALSVAVGDRKLLANSLKTGLTSFVIAILAATVAAAPFNIVMNDSLALVSSPTMLSLLLSIFVGAAASLTFVTGLRDEMAGVAVAIALIPPIASIGIGIRMLDIQMVTNALTVVLINMISIISAGFICFRVIGVKPSTYYKKKQAEKMRYILPLTLLLLLALSLPVAISSYQDSQDLTSEERLDRFGNEFFGEDLLKADTAGSEATFYVVGGFNETEMNREKPPGTEISVIRLQPAD